MTAQTYSAFLEAKRRDTPSVGPVVQPGKVHPMLFPFQRDLTIWALRKGRAALFADTGLGKTFMQLEWARLLGERTLIVAPLSVARQTSREAHKLGMEVPYVRSGADAARISITNYEMLEHFDAADFGAVVLDESSILKAMDGKTRKRLTDMFAKTPYRLACTATPAPNDLAEIGNHAEFLGVASVQEMLSEFFVHKADESRKTGWTVKGHAETAFYRWLASWSMSVRKPSDLGYDDDGYALPELHIIPEWVDSSFVPEGQLFFGGLKGITDRSAVRRSTLTDRVSRASELVNAGEGQWLVWHGLNDEGYMLRDSISGSVLVEGSQSPESKAAAIEAFQDGETRVLITKPRIAGFGMNFQNAHQMAFVGLSDSWEAYYQCVRRCWRFGQEREVSAHVVLSEAESAIYENVMRKEEQAQDMGEKLLAAVKDYERLELQENGTMGEDYATDIQQGIGWTMRLGDSVERLKEIETASVGMSVFSPPFLSLYTYSPTDRDLGNSRGDDQFWTHFRFIMDELLRVTMPGRNACVHVSQVPRTVAHDGVTAMKDFRGQTIVAFEEAGWLYHGEVCIDKDPQAQAIRTKSKGLMFVQKARDRSWLRPAMADYILVFRKPGDNAVPIRSDEVSNDDWISWARPIWYGIRESDTLNVAEGRDEKDEKHVAPLQLETIRRCVLLWSNKGETVLSPFGGIGSEGYAALREGRKYSGIELKESYYRAAVRNLQRADAQMDMGLLSVTA